MQCPKCHKDVPPGNLYCPECLTEIPWVKEFDTVEMRQKKKEEPSGSKMTPDEHSSNARTWIIHLLILVSIAATGAAGLVSYYNYRKSHTFDALIERAEKEEAQGRYDKALTAATEAVNKAPDDLDANLLLAGIMTENDDPDSAVLVLKPMLSTYPDDARLYQAMAKALYQSGDYQTLSSLFDDVDNKEIFAVCNDYIARKPAPNLSEGTYTDTISVELIAEGETIYYTTDGTKPTTESTVYDGPVTLSQGTTILQAFGVNALGIQSEIMTRKYVVQLETPEAPSVTPEEGTYYANTMIRIDVPEGCTAYYAFDEEPTQESTVYTQPISMPVDTHTFYAFLVGANGKVSDTTTVIYSLEID